VAFFCLKNVECINMANFIRKFLLLFFILLATVLIFKFGNTKNIKIELSEIFSHLGFLSASLISNPDELSAIYKQDLTDDLPPIQTQQEQVLVEELTSNSFVADSHQLTQEEIQEELDDISEKIDLIEQQVSYLIEASLPEDFKAEPEEKLEEDKEDKTDETDQEDKIDEQNKLQEEESFKKIKSGGFKPNYLKILISEAQIAGQDDEKQEFIELYNPNDVTIDLTGWYLQKKTSGGSNWSTYAPNNLFSGKKIFGKGYFLVARTGYYSELADIFTDGSITDDNSFALKNPNGDISDKLGFGSAQDPELMPAINPGAGQSVGRKVLESGEEEEIDDNSFDFELQTPTPKARNIIFVESSAPLLVALKNILINEVQIGDNEFVELYNPNLVEVDLTGWYLQRKTAEGDEYSSFAPSSLFSEKSIGANGYFLIARQDSSFAGISDIIIDKPLTENNSLVLKNSGKDISDKLGFGLAQDFETASAQEFLSGQSLGRKFDEASQTNLDTDSNLADFELNTPTPKEKNIKWIEPAKDTTPPEVNFTLAVTQTNLNFPVDFAITDPLDTVTPSGVASYIFRWKEESSEWQEDALQSFSENPLKRDFISEDKKTYYFQIKAKDLAGNESVWLPEEPVFTKIELPVIETKPIIINEIQTEGQTVKDEFIELYNPNDFGVDLTGFSLKKKTSGGTESNLASSGNFTGIIPAFGYFLIVPQNNDDGTPNYTGLAIPDLYYSGKTYSVASDNTVLLYDKNDTLQDKVGFGLAVDFEMSPAQNSQTGKSIQRKSLGEDANDNSADFIVLDTPTPKSQ